MPDAHRRLVFEDGRNGLSWREAKGRKAINQAECGMLYSLLCNHYISEHPELIQVLRDATGLSDMFGQPGHACQATELWRIRSEHKLELFYRPDPPGFNRLYD